VQRSLRKNAHLNYESVSAPTPAPGSLRNEKSTREADSPGGERISTHWRSAKSAPQTWRASSEPLFVDPRNPVPLYALGCGACDKQVRRSAQLLLRIWAKRTHHHPAAPGAAAQEITPGDSKLHCAVASRPDVARGARSICLCSVQDSLLHKVSPVVAAPPPSQVRCMRAVSYTHSPCAALLGFVLQGRVGSTTVAAPRVSILRRVLLAAALAGGTWSGGCSHTGAHTDRLGAAVLVPGLAQQHEQCPLTSLTFSTLRACTAGPRSADCDQLARSSQRTCFHVKCSAIRCPAGFTATWERFTALTSPQRPRSGRCALQTLQSGACHCSASNYSLYSQWRPHHKLYALVI
jgi:hypothetical protein